MRNWRPDPQGNGSPTLRIHRIRRISRRWWRAHASPLSGTIGPSTLEYGTVLRAPPDDEMVPAGQHFPLSTIPPFQLVESEFEPPRADGHDVHMPNVHTPSPTQEFP